MIELRWRNVKDPGSTIRPPIRPLPERNNCALDLACTAHADRAQLHAQRRGRGLHDGELTNSGYQGRIAKDHRSRDPWRDFLEQLQPFRANTELEWGEFGRVAARASQALDEART